MVTGVTAGDSPAKCAQQSRSGLLKNQGLYHGTASAMPEAFENRRPLGRRYHRIPTFFAAVLEHL